MPYIPRWSREKKKSFLETLRRTGNVSSAARKAGVEISKAYSKRAQDQSFRKDWDGAIEGALDDLEEEVRRRALEGTKKPVYYAGKECGSVVSFNDNLAIFLLKAKRPQIFSEGVLEDQNFHLLSADPKEKLLKKLLEMNSKKSETKE